MRVLAILLGFAQLDPEHIYQEFNEEVLLLSEQALLMEKGKIYVSQFWDDGLVTKSFFYVLFCRREFLLFWPLLRVSL